MIAGCTGAVRGGILYLTLDSRGSSVNVFTPAVALELERELQAGLDAGARAVVLQSAKPGSFVNGVGLLLAASSHAESAAMERARTLQRCYERLAAAPVPTIAAISGNCYGCGLELALTCDYRLAAGGYDTHFYMPELRDYAFIPLFGGTQRLPRLLGLRQGMRVLLGERIDAREALRIGLVDRVARRSAPGADLRSFLSDLRARGWPKRKQKRLRPSRPAPLGDLPGPERRLAAEGLRLALLPFAPGYRLEHGLREELASFWKSLGTAESVRAMSFFFVRQAAKASAIGSASYTRPARMTLAVLPRTPALRRLSRMLRERRLPGIELRARAEITFAARKVEGTFTCALDRPGAAADCAAWLPFPDEPIPAIELVPADRTIPWKKGAALVQVLEQAGLAPVVTLARDRFVSERLIEAFAGAVGSAPARDALLDFGFRLPRALARRVRPGASEGVAERAAAALAAVCLRALDEGELAHPSQADLLAHALFGFPVIHGGLLRYTASATSPVARDAARVLGR
ncbi:MAG TPA: enoyl-CoA hydratase/isomerase family protein [Myxococcales bacterium]|nr:enoyl-CoA hydratase/isomerase family protein [Myxococcales bacterium]